MSIYIQFTISFRLFTVIQNYNSNNNHIKNVLTTSIHNQWLHYRYIIFHTQNTTHKNDIVLMALKKVALFLTDFLLKPYSRIFFHHFLLWHKLCSSMVWMGKRGRIHIHPPQHGRVEHGSWLEKKTTKFFFTVLLNLIKVLLPLLSVSLSLSACLPASRFASTNATAIRKRKKYTVFYINNFEFNIPLLPTH